jgi:hypothetical protein
MTQPLVDVFARLLALPLLFTLSIEAQQKPDFSGDYVLSKARSALSADYAALEQATVRVVHREPAFAMHRVFKEGGKDDVLDMEVKTDGQETVTRAGARAEYRRAYWDGPALVVSTRIVIPQGEAINVVRYTLTDGGRTLQADEQFRAPKRQYDNRWIFEKQEHPEAAQRYPHSVDGDGGRLAGIAVPARMPPSIVISLPVM